MRKDLNKYRNISTIALKGKDSVYFTLLNYPRYTLYPVNILIIELLSKNISVSNANVFSQKRSPYNN